MSDKFKNVGLSNETQESDLSDGSGPKNLSRPGSGIGKIDEKALRRDDGSSKGEGSDLLDPSEKSKLKPSGF